MSDYPRCKLTEDEYRKLANIAFKINLLKMAERQQVITRILTENASLLHECNEHRQVRGFEIIQAHDPKE
jgi:hypothetical protein